MRRTRADHNIHWIEAYCVEPDGPRKGEPVHLSADERLTIRRIYGAPGGPYADVPVSGPLAAYLILLHICGPEALQNKFSGPATLSVDTWTVWRATTPQLQAVLKRRGEVIVCPELGTAYPHAA